MKSTILSMANWVGVFCFAFEGTLNAKREHAGFWFSILCGLISTYGGGFFFRDILVLHTIPSVFFEGGEVTFAISCILFGSWVYHNDTLMHVTTLPSTKRVLCIMDSFGVAAFAVSGIESALNYNIPAPMVVFCGFVSCVGGGFISMILTVDRDKLNEALRKKASYYGFAMLTTIYYYVGRGSNFDFSLYTILIVVAGVLRDYIIKLGFHNWYRKTVSILSLPNPIVMLHFSGSIYSFVRPVQTSVMVPFPYKPTSHYRPPR